MSARFFSTGGNTEFLELFFVGNLSNKVEFSTFKSLVQDIGDFRPVLRPDDKIYPFYRCPALRKASCRPDHRLWILPPRPCNHVLIKYASAFW